MQAFGIEIRKTNTKSIYEDVDSILRKNGITALLVSDNVKIKTVAHSLQKMLQVDNFFSICTIEHCANLCQINIPLERSRVYKACHCMNWRDMLPDYREMLVALILDDFRAVLYTEEQIKLI